MVPFWSAGEDLKMLQKILQSCFCVRVGLISRETRPFSGVGRAVSDVLGWGRNGSCAGPAWRSAVRELGLPSKCSTLYILCVKTRELNTSNYGNFTADRGQCVHISIRDMRGEPPNLEFIYYKLWIYSYMLKLQSLSKYSPFDAIHRSKPIFHCSE